MGSLSDKENQLSGEAGVENLAPAWGILFVLQETFVEVETVVSGEETLLLVVLPHLCHHLQQYPQLLDLSSMRRQRL